MGKKSKIKTFLSKLGKKRLSKYEEQSTTGLDDSYDQDSETQSVDKLPTGKSWKSENFLQSEDSKVVEQEAGIPLALSFQGCLITDSQESLMGTGVGNPHPTQLEDIPYIDDVFELASDISLDSQCPEGLPRFFHTHTDELFYEENMPVENSPRNRRPLLIPQPKGDKLLAVSVGPNGSHSENDEAKENRGGATHGFPFTDIKKRQLLIHSGKTPDECTAARIGKFTSFPQNGNLLKPVPIDPKDFVKNINLKHRRRSSRKDSVDKEERIKDAAVPNDVRSKRSKSNKQLVNQIQSQMQRSAENHSSLTVPVYGNGSEVTGRVQDSDVSEPPHSGTQMLTNNADIKGLEKLTKSRPKTDKINAETHEAEVKPISQDVISLNGSQKELRDNPKSYDKPSRIPRRTSSTSESAASLSSKSSEKVTKKKRKTEKKNLKSPSQESIDPISTSGDIHVSEMSQSFDIGPPLATSTGPRKKSSKSEKPNKLLTNSSSITGDKKKRKKDQGEILDETKTSDSKGNTVPDKKGAVPESESMEVQYSDYKEQSSSAANSSNTLAVVEPQQTKVTSEAVTLPATRTRRRRRNRDEISIESSNEETHLSSTVSTTNNDSFIDPAKEICDNHKIDTSNADESTCQGSSLTTTQRNVVTPIIHYHVTLQNCDGININVNRNDPTVGPVPGAIEVNRQGQLQHLNWIETMDTTSPIGSVPFGPLIQSSESWSETSTNSTIIAGHGDYETNLPSSSQTKDLSSETNTTLLATTEVNFDDTCAVSDVTCDTTYLVDADAWGCEGVNASLEHFSVCGHSSMDKGASTSSLEQTRYGENSVLQHKQSGINTVSKSVPYRLNKFSNKSNDSSPTSKGKEFSPPWRSQSTTSASSNGSSTCEENVKEKVNDGQKEKSKSSSQGFGVKLRSALTRSKSKESQESKPKVSKESKQSGHSRLFHNLLNPSKHKEGTPGNKSKKHDGNGKPPSKEVQDAANSQIKHKHENRETLPSTSKDSNSSRLSNNTKATENKKGTMHCTTGTLFDNCNFQETVTSASATKEDNNVTSVPVSEANEINDATQCVKPKIPQTLASNRPILMPHSGSQSPKPVAKVMPMTRTTDSTGRVVAGSRTLLQGYTFRFAGNTTTTNATTTSTSVTSVAVTSASITSSAFSSYINPSSISALPQTSATVITTSATNFSTVTTQSQYTSYTPSTYSNTHVGSTSHLTTTTGQIVSTLANTGGAYSYSSYNSNVFPTSSVQSTTSRSSPVTSVLSPSEQILSQPSPFSRSDARRRTARNISSMPHVVVSSTRTRSRTSARSRMLQTPLIESPTAVSRPSSRLSRTTPTSEVYSHGRTSRGTTSYAAQDSTDDDNDDNTASTTALLESPANFVDVDEDLDATSTTFSRYGLGSTIQPTMIRRRGGRSGSSRGQAPTIEERVSSLRDAIVRVPGVLILSTRRNRMVVYLSQDRPNVDGVIEFMQGQGVGRSEYEVEVLPWGHRGSINGTST